MPPRTPHPVHHPRRRRATRHLGVLLVLVALTGACSKTVKSKPLYDTTDSTSTGSGTGTDTSGGSGGVLAPPGATGKTVHGIKCESAEQLEYHIHSHLEIYVDGARKLVPASIGISGGTCIYWLHTHDVSGILHVESPDSRTFHLGDFFAVWNQPLSGTQVGPAHGKVTAYVDGRPYAGDPADIPLRSRTVIQLDVGTPAPKPHSFTFPDGY